MSTDLGGPVVIRPCQKLAEDDKQYSVALAAVKEIGILTGRRIERREAGGPGEFAEIENMTAAELVASAAAA